MSRLSMKHLRYFDALARFGHFGHAAESCAITQPALSVQIKELEQLIGTPLVERGARQIRLTSFGEEFAKRAGDILRSVDELEDMARASQTPLIGRLRIGVIPTVAPYLLADVIKELFRQYPGLDLRPREAVTQKLIEDLVGGRMDAAIVALPISEPSLHEETLFEEEFVLVRPLKDADLPVPNSAMLREMRLLLLEEGHCFRDQAISFCKMSSTMPRDLMEGSSLSTLVQMVGAGIGVTLIPEMAVPIETSSAAVTVFRLAAPRPSRTIGMVWRKTNPLSDQLAQIAEVVRQAGTRKI
ncbi:MULTISPECIES: hydrogen peroxide-inducible genes activator [Falsihalocynthiibacter]|uniref:LysR family transcriptional regulator n=1 Tax=Falsihalocynthiibacter arcticus TaxID=1579316 RepID=A0A126UWR6_9RHOB|nr:hydrogen peroxide-inducible genes activator [Falsihalocynthiibacter arcticus]AML50490.1 LysR family transcriptional regulator [Falsihalocynthiibacter arcticus]